jgi:hypothetical protein
VQVEAGPQVVGVHQVLVTMNHILKLLKLMIFVQMNFLILKKQLQNFHLLRFHLLLLQDYNVLVPQE